MLGRRQLLLSLGLVKLARANLAAAVTILLHLLLLEERFVALQATHLDLELAIQFGFVLSLLHELTVLELDRRDLLHVLRQMLMKLVGQDIGEVRGIVASHEAIEGGGVHISLHLALLVEHCLIMSASGLLRSITLSIDSLLATKLARQGRNHIRVSIVVSISQISVHLVNESNLVHEILVEIAGGCRVDRLSGLSELIAERRLIRIRHGRLFLLEHDNLLEHIDDLVLLLELLLHLLLGHASVAEEHLQLVHKGRRSRVLQLGRALEEALRIDESLEALDEVRHAITQRAQAIILLLEVGDELILNVQLLLLRLQLLIDLSEP